MLTDIRHETKGIVGQMNAVLNGEFAREELLKSLKITVEDELAQRLEREAHQQRISPEELARRIQDEDLSRGSVDALHQQLSQLRSKTID